MAKERTLAVVGAGNMGSGIAQKMATEGFRVVLLDLNDKALERGLSIIETTLAEAVERRILREPQVEQIRQRIHGTTDWKSVREAELVVEAVFEDLEVKREVFRKLSEACEASTILGTNTSSFYVKDLAEVVQAPERVVGLHYFYHPAKNRLVEVVPAEKTSPAVVRAAWSVQEALGKTPIACADAPGFVVNRYFVPWLNESVRLLEEGVSLPTIEAAAKSAFRIGMGPFELMNVTGVPIALHAAETLGKELGEFYAPSARLRQQVETKKNWDLSGDAEEEGARAVAERLLGVVFQVAGELVDEGVGSIEDTDIGARVGLRWAKGPFELMNRQSPATARDLAKAVADRYGRSVPKVIQQQAEQGKPFSFRLVETQKDEGVAVLTLNRPDAMNAINPEVVAQLEAGFETVRSDSEVKTVALAGKGKAFIAGADIRFFVRHLEADNLPAIREFTERGARLLASFSASDPVVVAQLDGLSLGGGSEIALACDYIAATSKGSMGFPETGIGIYPGLGGTQRLTRRIGVPLARWLVLSGASIHAALAQEIGLVDVVVDAGSLPQAIRKLGERGKPDRTQAPPTTVPAGFEELVEVFSEPLSDLLARDEGSVQDARATKALRALARKAPVALRIADELIRGGAEGSLADGLGQELARLEEIFRTKDALLGLSSLGGPPPKFAGQ